MHRGSLFVWRAGSGDLREINGGKAVGSMRDSREGDARWRKIRNGAKNIGEIVEPIAKKSGSDGKFWSLHEQNFLKPDLTIFEIFFEARS
jgi:hypothetical protein